MGYTHPVKRPVAIKNGFSWPALDQALATVLADDNDSGHALADRGRMKA